MLNHTHKLMLSVIPIPVLAVGADATNFLCQFQRFRRLKIRNYGSATSIRTKHVEYNTFDVTRRDTTGRRKRTRTEERSSVPCFNFSIFLVHAPSSSPLYSTNPYRPMLIASYALSRVLEPLSTSLSHRYYRIHRCQYILTSGEGIFTSKRIDGLSHQQIALLPL